MRAPWRLLVLALVGLSSAGLSSAWMQSAGREDLLEFARLRCSGPLDSIVLDMEAAGQTRVDLRLDEGEVSSLMVPLPPRLLAASPPDIQVASDYGSTQWRGWVESGERDSHWAEFPTGLKARPRPPVRPASVSASLSSLALALATALLVVGLRSSPWRALLLACALGAGAVWLVGAQAEPLPSHVRVLEGLGGIDGVDAEWLVSRSADEVLIVDPDSCLRLEGSGPGRLEWQVTVNDLGQTHRAQLAGQTLTSFADLDPGTRRCTAEINAWGTLDQVWTRAGDGTWRYHGTWPMGESLPKTDGGGAGAQGQNPPGWLSSSLPMGTPVLVALLGASAWAGPATEAGEVSWLRWVGWNTAGGH